MEPRQGRMKERKKDGADLPELLGHVVFGTKGRRRIIDDRLRARLWEYLGGIARHEFGGIVRVGGTEDHVHGLIRLRADTSVAEAMRKWKSLSIGWVHREFSDLDAFAWQGGYGAFSVSPSREAGVISYIENQMEHHREVSFEEEFEGMLARCGIEFDRRYLWTGE